jgi:hypothetical protein
MREMQLKMRKAQLEAAEKATARVAPVPDCVTTWNADKVAQFLSRTFHARSEEYGVMQRLEIDDKQLKFMVERMEPQEIEQPLLHWMQASYLSRGGSSTNSWLTFSRPVSLRLTRKCGQ